jgi:hypothetical protein
MKAILLISGLLYFSSVSAQECICAPEARNIYAVDSLQLCAVVFDSSRRETMLLNPFICYRDSIILDAREEKEAYFILRKLPDGLSLVQMDVKIEAGRMTYPANFNRLTVMMADGQLMITENEMPAAPLVSLMRYELKKFSQLGQ